MSRFVQGKTFCFLSLGCFVRFWVLVVSRLVGSLELEMFIWDAVCQTILVKLVYELLCAAFWLGVSHTSIYAPVSCRG